MSRFGTKGEGLVAMLRALVFISYGLLASCHGYSEPIESGSQEISGLFVKEDIGQLCTYRFFLPQSSRYAIYDVIDKEARSIESRATHLVTKVSYGVHSFVDIASPEFCDHSSNSDRETPSRFFRSAISIEKGEEFSPVPTEVLLSEYPINRIDNERNNFEHTHCFIERRLEKRISLDDVITLRFTYSIPIVFHQWSDELSVIVFENDCGNAERYLDDIAMILDLG